MKNSDSYHLFVAGFRPQGENQQQKNRKNLAAAGYNRVFGNNVRSAA
jgi:hypothetical protein